MQTITMKRYATFCSILLEQTWNPMYKLNALYQYSQSHQVETEAPLFCPEVNDLEQYDTSFYSPFFCYAAQDGPTYQTYTQSPLTQSFVTLNSIVNPILMEFDITQMFMNQQFYFALNTPDQLTSVWPQQPAQPFLPLTRPWFINHVKSKEEHPKLDQFYSSLYQFKRFQGVWNTIYGITQTQSLLNNGTLVGVIAEDINFQIMQSIIKNYEDLNIMFLYVNGQLLFQNTFLGINLSKEHVISIFDEKRTGFNSSDWTILQQTASSTNSVHLFNSIFGFEVLINIQKLPNTPFYLMIFNNLVHEEQQQQLMKKLLSQLQEEYLDNIYLFTIIISSSAIIIVIGIIQIVKPVYQIKDVISNYKFTKCLKLKQDVSNNQLLSLKQTIIKKHNQLQCISFTKHELCRLIEGFNYYQRRFQSKLQFYVMYIQNQSTDFEENEAYLTCIRNLEVKI